MWWINKFGSVSGPYSDEQVEKGIRQNLFTKLHKISSDRVTWQRIEQTAFWAPVSHAPVEMEIPDEQPRRGKLGSIVHEAAASPAPSGPTPEETAATLPPKPTVPPPPSGRREVNWKGVSAVCAACLVAAVLLSVGLLISRSGGTPAPSSSPESDTAKPAASAAPPPAPTASSAPVAANDFEAVKRRVLLVHSENGSGTAFLVKMGGKKYVLTNDHVIRSASAPEMVTLDGKKLALGALSVAKDRDLARFEVDYDGEFFELSDKLPNNNDEIWVYGNSQGDDVITSLRGFVTGVGSKILKVNAEFVGGNSGSPILGMDGKVVAVAAYIVNGDGGKDWSTKDTQFDEVRRFGIRLANVSWVDIDRRHYLQACARLEQMKTYWKFLIPYLIWEDASEKDFETLKLVHKEIDRKAFGRDEAGFHEMLTALSKAYAGLGSSERKIDGFLRNRKALIEKLDAAVKSNDLTVKNAQKALDEFDAKGGATWENFKTKRRDFCAKRKEALIMARSFLTGFDWQSPLMKHGYATDDKRNSVDLYLEGVQYFLDVNAQRLKDLNKSFSEIEKGEDDDEE